MLFSSSKLGRVPSSIPDLNWNALYGFWLVARHGSYAAAAKALPRGSVQALHKRVQLLEGPESLNLKLLKSRGVKGVRLTEAGRRLFEHVDGVFRSFDLLVGELRGEDAGPLIVGMTRHAAYNYAPDILQVFHAAFPKVSLTIFVRDSSIEVSELVEDEKVDVGICTPRRGAKRLTVAGRTPIEVNLLAPRDHPLPSHSLTWEQIVAEPVVLSDRNSIVREAVEELLHRKGLLARLRIAAELTDPELAVEAVRAGYGLAIFPIGPRLANQLGGICRLPLPAGLPPIELAVVHRPHMYMPRHLREFMQVSSMVIVDQNQELLCGSSSLSEP